MKKNKSSVVILNKILVHKGTTEFMSTATVPLKKRGIIPAWMVSLHWCQLVLHANDSTEQ